ncbi:MAG TPA: hypothetical protein VHK70_03460 [Burkholderiaceae bacterium]|nr:hypothetical protein [Burkholderiaceae bacterium]
MPSTIFSIENLSSNLFLDAAPKLAILSGAFSRIVMASASAPASFGGTSNPVMPRPITSGMLSTREAIAAFAADAASIREIDKPSLRDGRMQRSAVLSNCGISSRRLSHAAAFSPSLFLSLLPQEVSCPAKKFHRGAMLFPDRLYRLERNIVPFYFGYPTDQQDRAILRVQPQFFAQAFARAAFFYAEAAIARPRLYGCVGLVRSA